MKEYQGFLSLLLCVGFVIVSSEARSESRQQKPLQRPVEVEIEPKDLGYKGGKVFLDKNYVKINGMVEGQVPPKWGFAPLEGVTVEVDLPPYGNIEGETNAKGKYHLETSWGPSKTANFTFSKQGYKTATVSQPLGGKSVLEMKTVQLIAEKASLSGQVFDAKTFKPLKNIVVGLQGPDDFKLGASSNAQGNFKINDIPEGQYELFAKKEKGYQAFGGVLLTFKGGEKQTFDIPLTPSDVPQ